MVTLIDRVETYFNITVDISVSLSVIGVNNCRSPATARSVQRLHPRAQNHSAIFPAAISKRSDGRIARLAAHSRINGRVEIYVYRTNEGEEKRRVG